MLHQICVRQWRRAMSLIANGYDWRVVLFLPLLDLHRLMLEHLRSLVSRRSARPTCRDTR